MKKQVIIGIVLLISGIIRAQQPEQYLFINGGAGYHNLSYDLKFGSEKGQVGYTLNAGYSYFFNPHWGLQSGIGIQSFSALSTLNYGSTTPNVDTDGQAYSFMANYKDWKEKQQVLFFEVPLVLQYKCALSPKFGLLASAGANISLPITANYKTSGGQIVTSGYYSQYNVVLSNMPQHGFSTFTNSYKGDVSLKPAYLGVAELGGLIRIAEKTELYIGGYLNYGLNNVLKSDSKLMFQPDGTYNSVFASDLTNKVIPMSVGVKLGLYWRLGKAKQILHIDELPVAKQPADSVQKIVVTQLDSVKPQKTEIPTIVLVDQVVKAPVQIKDSVYAEDPFERAKRIAASMVVRFGFNSDQTLTSENEKIKELSDILKSNPTICLRIVGHTCNIGSHEINFVVGKKRAVIVRQKFLGQGVSEDQLVTDSKAYDQPLVPNTTKENRAKNRRIEVNPFKKAKL